MFGIDDALLAAGVTAVGSAIGNWWSADSAARGQRQANQANVASARDAMAFSERMSNTQWQRGVADMRAAGINPMLAFSKGGASSPTGVTSSSMPSRPDYGRGVSSAASVIQQELSNRLLLAQLQQAQADTKIKQNQGRIIAKEADRDTGTAGDIAYWIERLGNSAQSLLSGFSPLAAIGKGLGSIIRRGVPHSASRVDSVYGSAPIVDRR